MLIQSVDVTESSADPNFGAIKQYDCANLGCCQFVHQIILYLLTPSYSHHCIHYIMNIMVNHSFEIVL